METTEMERKPPKEAKRVFAGGRFVIFCQRAVLLALAMAILTVHGLKPPSSGSATAGSPLDYALAPAVSGSVAFVQLSHIAIIALDKFCDPHLSVIWDAAAVVLYVWLIVERLIYWADVSLTLVVLPIVAMLGHAGIVIQDAKAIIRLQRFLAERQEKRRAAREKLLEAMKKEASPDSRGATLRRSSGHRSSDRNGTFQPVVNPVITEVDEPKKVSSDVAASPSVEDTHSKSNQSSDVETTSLFQRASSQQRVGSFLASALFPFPHMKHTTTSQSLPSKEEEEMKSQRQLSKTSVGTSRTPERNEGSLISTSQPKPQPSQPSQHEKPSTDQGIVSQTADTSVPSSAPSQHAQPSQPSQHEKASTDQGKVSQTADTPVPSSAPSQHAQASPSKQEDKNTAVPKVPQTSVGLPEKTSEKPKRTRESISEPTSHVTMPVEQERINVDQQEPSKSKESQPDTSTISQHRSDLSKREPTSQHSNQRPRRRSKPPPDASSEHRSSASPQTGAIPRHPNAGPSRRTDTPVVGIPDREIGDGPQEKGRLKKRQPMESTTDSSYYDSSTSQFQSKTSSESDSSSDTESSENSDSSFSSISSTGTEISVKATI